MVPTSSGNFYKRLSSFQTFEGIADPDNYRRVPDDWWVCLSDVRNSSKVIAEGRYRDINKIGAATVTTVLNIPELNEIPFTFGGDGASVLVPESFLETVKPELASLRELAREKFKLDLRTAAVSLQEIRQAGHELEVAKLKLNENQSIATFRGGGLSFAEKTMKQSRQEHSIDSEPEDDFSLENLSCRWKPIPSKNGVVLSVLVRARSDSPETVYRSVLRDLNNMLDSGLDHSNPVNRSDMRYRSIRESLRDEIRYHDSLFSIAFVMRFFEIILAVSIFRVGFNPGVLDTDQYVREMEQQSDYRKFDDMLRFIVDCSPEDFEEVESYLENRRSNGNLYYGLHRSDHTLMTCYVPNVNNGDHMHFVDGSDGGYAMAAQQMKKQIGNL